MSRSREKVQCRNSSQSVFDNEGDLQLDAVFPDFSFMIQYDLLILDPCRLEIRECFMSAGDADHNGIIEALRGRGNDFSYFCD
jgi:hypothetical protein